MEVIVKTKNVHNKALFEKINEYVEDMSLFVGLLSSTNDIANLIEMLLFSEADFYKIEQAYIIADKRNNKPADTRNGISNIDIYYKHLNCYNTTHLSYRLIRKIK